ncbi:hypothetical protein C0Q70_03543 [Pomacea canaliculata]|uniref:Uncharacterized protein n=1 Tax=Pomacea canaliculata TaxID=400727 RepID=A0A2T7PT06_POMCA|nr:hypothetical protein C0Q70_03543 [Pomacea canaliculata]
MCTQCWHHPDTTLAPPWHPVTASRGCPPPRLGRAVGRREIEASLPAVDVIATERVWGGPVVGVSQRRGLQSLRDAQESITCLHSKLPANYENKSVYGMNKDPAQPAVRHTPTDNAVR